MSFPTSRSMSRNSGVLDGKYVRDQVLTVCLSDHETGAPVAIAVADPAPRTEDNKKEGELTAARRLAQQCRLDNALVSGDALHCERQNAFNLPEAGGDFLFQLKDNQPTAIEQARKIVATQPPLFAPRASTSGTADSTNGR